MFTEGAAFHWELFPDRRLTALGNVVRHWEGVHARMTVAWQKRQPAHTRLTLVSWHRPNFYMKKCSMHKWNDKMDLFRESWSGVRRNYCDGFCVSEAGFQADLYEQLRQRLQSCNVIAGPIWEDTVDGRRRPDLVIAQEGFITDILELKFVPHWYAVWKPDIRKLRRYLDPKGPRAYPVSLCPETGKWVEDTPLHEECRLHFVVVSQHDAAAIRAPIPDGEPPINRWRGPVEDPLPEWHIQFNA